MGSASRWGDLQNHIAKFLNQGRGGELGPLSINLSKERTPLFQLYFKKSCVSI